MDWLPISQLSHQTTAHFNILLSPKWFQKVRRKPRSDASSTGGHADVRLAIIHTRLRRSLQVLADGAVSEKLRTVRYARSGAAVGSGRLRRVRGPFSTLPMNV